MSASEEPRSNSFVECAICMEIYDDPRILPCGHTFCLKCVQSKQIVASSKSSENTHQCSICRQICAIPAGGLEALPKNFVVNDLKGFIAQKSGSVSFTDRCALVDDGDDHGLVEYFCVDCWYPLCNLCFRFHKKSRQTMGHVVKRLADVTETDYAKHRTQLSLTCTKHTKKDLEFYCNGCAELLCSTCCLTSHKTHDYVELSEADETFKQKITNKVVKMRDAEKITQSQLNKGTEALKSLETHQQSITADINTFADKLLQTALDKISTDLKASKTKILHELTGKILTEKTKLEKFVESRKQSLALAQADVSTLEGLLPSSSNVAERAAAMKLKMFKDSNEEQIVGDDGFEASFDTSDAALAWKFNADCWLKSILSIPAAGEERSSKQLSAKASVKRSSRMLIHKKKKKLDHDQTVQ
jgi:tripartite motif-containing protein 56